MKIVGAGMAGLLAGGILRDKLSAVYERQHSLPNNHSAVLRFRTTKVSDALNIPFKKVTMIKSYQPWMNPVADAHAYSIKTNGSATLRSIVSADGQPRERYIAPHDMIWQMEKKLSKPVTYRSEFPLHLLGTKQPIISTIPMPALMALLKWPGKSPKFETVSGYSYRATFEGLDSYCSVYVPDPEIPLSRVSVTGNEIIAESDNSLPSITAKDAIHLAIKVLGLEAGIGSGFINFEADPIKIDQKYAKILPIDESTRREFIVWASKEHRVYSLGRFATWRPGLLLDDVVNDVSVIQRLESAQGESYTQTKKG
jgi:hypothetical protein